MPRFSRSGQAKLAQLDHEFAQLLYEVVREFDCSIIWTHRNEQQQNDANELGFSKLRWPKSKHNQLPSRAVDVVPYPGGYQASYEQFFEMATYILAEACKRGLYVRWGGHWKNYNGYGMYDRDWAHFELVP